MVTSLSKHKFEYLIDQITNDLVNPTTYHIQKYSSGDIYSLTGRIEYDIIIKSGKLIRVAIKKGTFGSIIINYTLNGTEDKELVSKFVEYFLNKIIDIEESEFKSVFPGYDSSEDRDLKLKELLGETKSENQKKKWWKI